MWEENVPETLLKRNMIGKISSQEHLFHFPAQKITEV